MHLRFRHDSAVLTVERRHSGELIHEGLLAYQARSLTAHLVLGATDLKQVDQVVRKRPWPIPKGRPEEGRVGDEQSKFADQVGRRLQEVASLTKSLLDEVVRFHRVTLEVAHLLEIPNSTVSHLRAFARCASCEIVRVNYGAFQTSRCSIENDASSIRTTTDNQNVKLLAGVLQFAEMFIAAFQLIFVLDPIGI